MGFLANGTAVWVTFIIGLILFGVTLWLLFGEDSDRSTRTVAVITGLLCVVMGFAWFYGTTHRVVPPNARWLIINTANGTIDGTIRQSGITEKPFMLYRIQEYPGASEQPFCIDYYPASKEGYEVLAHICGTYNASTLDWAKQYSLHNFTSEAEMLTYWSNQAKNEVRSIFKDVDYAHLNSDTISVSNSLSQVLTAWLTSQDINATNITLSNWSLTSVEVNKQIDAASAASMQSTVETQKLAAAKIARERQVYEIETANLVLNERGKGLLALFTSLGITDDSAKAFLASQMTWFAYAQNPPAGVNVIIGADAIAVPAGQQPTPAPAPTSAP